MSKKTFKNRTDHLDRFFSEPEENRTHETHETQGTYRTHEENTPTKKNFPVSSGFPSTLPATGPEEKPKYYRLNLKLKPEFKEYLDRISWENRKSITQYLNELIQADMDRQPIMDI